MMPLISYELLKVLKGYSSFKKICFLLLKCKFIQLDTPKSNQIIHSAGGRFGASGHFSPCVAVVIMCSQDVFQHRYTEKNLTHAMHHGVQRDESQFRYWRSVCHLRRPKAQVSPTSAPYRDADAATSSRLSKIETTDLFTTLMSTTPATTPRNVAAASHIPPSPRALTIWALNRWQHQQAGKWWQ